MHLVDNPHDPALASLARLRLAQVLFQQNKADEALKQLDGDAGSYAALYDQLRGDIKLSQGDRAAARAAYQQALGALSADEAVSRDGLQRKLDDLADAAPEHS
jgi:predicted negative regulator of RcsB-dependent stress response